MCFTPLKIVHIFHVNTTIFTLQSWVYLWSESKRIHVFFNILTIDNLQTGHTYVFSPSKSVLCITTLCCNYRWESNAEHLHQFCTSGDWNIYFAKQLKLNYAAWRASENTNSWSDLGLEFDLVLPLHLIHLSILMSALISLLHPHSIVLPLSCFTVGLMCCVLHESQYV